MFIRRQGKRWELLHSCRDGAGRVYHRRLGHCADAVGLEGKLDEISRNSPEIRFDRARLMMKIRGTCSDGNRPERAVETGSEASCSGGWSLDATRRCDKIRRSARALLRLLAEEEEESVLQGAQEELSLLSARLQVVGEVDEVQLHRSRLSPRRRQFDCSDQKAKPYLAALDELSGKLERQGQLDEALAVMERRVKCCASPETLLRYGALLQRTGHFDQAARQYSRLSSQEAARHYNLASIAVLQQRYEEATLHLLKGITHDPQANSHYDESFGIRTMTGQAVLEDKSRPIGPHSEYWHQFGHLWTTEGREFVRKLCSQPLVRFRLNKSRKTGIRFRNLVPAASLKMLLGRIA